MIIAAFVPLLGLPFLFASGARILSDRPVPRFAVAVFACMSPLIARSPLKSWLLIGSLALILRVIAHFSDRPRRFDIETELPRILDVVVMSMKAGRAFKPALRDVARELSPAGERKLTEIVDRLELGGEDEGRPPRERDILRRLRAIDAGSARAIERLENWRRSVRVRGEFRRRSGQVTLQIRAQAALSGALFLPALAWNLSSGGPAALTRAAVASALFGAAQFWIHHSYRRWRWTV